MGARLKLNQAFVMGTLLTAAVFAGISDSLLVFFIVAGIGLALNYNSGDIRLGKRD
jgi:hypothetical protein